MLEVLHSETAVGCGGWEFDCPGVSAIHGGGRTFDASVAAAEHAARHHLSAQAGGAVALEDARRQLRHVRVETGAAGAPGRTDDALLTAVTESMVALHERYHGRRPLTAYTRLMDDELLVCVLGGVYSEVEKTMIELQRHALVAETRRTFHVAMRDKFVATIERLSGRRVLNFTSDTHVGPDLEVELFVLAPRAAA